MKNGDKRYSLNDVVDFDIYLSKYLQLFKLAYLILYSIIFHYNISLRAFSVILNKKNKKSIKVINGCTFNGTLGIAVLST